MNTSHPNRRKTAARAFSMVEVALALGIATYVLFSLLGVLNIGLATQKSSIQQTEALEIATAVVSDLRQVPKGAAVLESPKFAVNVAQTEAVLYVDAGGIVKASPENAQYRVTVTLNAPPVGSRSSTSGSVKVSWPAMAAEPAGSESVFVALNRN